MKIAPPLIALALGISLCAAASAEDTSLPLPIKHVQWSFEGPFGTYDQAALQRGFQIYKEVCSACHSLNLVAFHDLAAPGGPGFTEAQAKAIAAGYKIPAPPNDQGEVFDSNGNRLTRPGILADHFPPPFPNEEAARTANGGALPPDLSLIIKARAGGPDYVYSILTGFSQKPPMRIESFRLIQSNQNRRDGKTLSAERTQGDGRFQGDTRQNRDDRGIARDARCHLQNQPREW